MPFSMRAPHNLAPEGAQLGVDLIELVAEGFDIAARLNLRAALAERDCDETHRFRYPATRETANRIAITITIVPVKRTSRSANRRRNGSLPS
jgi:hypothetical protein